ncbi:ABC transporter permease, partial [Bradyrhizobium tunisiense]|uniref:ABC transporter permease n=1 Tax=Bradyrhizobium tunisiense TaxID=3278709 RepID=UPI0035D542E3
MTELRSHDQPGAVTDTIVWETVTAEHLRSSALKIPDVSPRNAWWDVWDQFKTHKGAVTGAAVFVLIILAVVLGPHIWRISPEYIDFTMINQGPSWAHPLGTDQLGRDLLARMMTGGRISIAVALTSKVISIFLGTLVGVLAGFFRRLDGPLMR